jgi:hypothetical protein
MHLALEIMLQQTRVAQVPYFFSLFSCISLFFDLAEANEEEVLKLWLRVIISCWIFKQCSIPWELAGVFR